MPVFTLLGRFVDKVVCNPFLFVDGLDASPVDLASKNIVFNEVTTFFGTRFTLTAVVFHKFNPKHFYCHVRGAQTGGWLRICDIEGVTPLPGVSVDGSNGFSTGIVTGRDPSHSIQYLVYEAGDVLASDPTVDLLYPKRTH